MIVAFQEEGHSYTSIDPNDKIDWLSITTIIANFKQPFNKEEKAKGCSKKASSKWYKMPWEKIIEVWDKEAERSVVLGKVFHTIRENETYSIDLPGIKVFKPIVKEGKKISPIQTLEEGIYPEHFVYLKSCGICGQSDKVTVKNGFVNILDYKTNKEIDRQAFQSWDGQYTMLAPPISHMHDCDIVHYAMQLSFYLYIILRHNPSLKPGILEIEHAKFEEEGKDEFGYPITKLDDNGNPILKSTELIKVPYLKREVVDVLNYLVENRETFKKKS